MSMKHLQLEGTLDMQAITTYGISEISFALTEAEHLRLAIETS